MAEQLSPDICVIGAGSGGLSVAAAAAQFGVDVVLIERGEMGGDCLNYGCVPSKSLIAAARRAHMMRASGPFGLTPLEPAIDFERVHDHIHEVIAAIAPNDSVERFTGLGVNVIKGEARFRDKDTVLADGREIKARRFVIATGSSPALPPIPGIERVPYFTNETIFDNKRKIEKLISSAAARSAWSWRTPSAGWAARSWCWRLSRRWPRKDPELPRSCCARWRRTASRSSRMRAWSGSSRSATGFR